MQYIGLPICGLPREHQGCRKHSIRCFSRESADGLLQSFQSNAAVLIGHIADQGAVGEERHVHGREREQSMHDIALGSTNLDDPGRCTCQAIAPHNRVSGDQPYVGIWRVQSVNPLASTVPSWWLIEATWWIKRISSMDRYCGFGAG